MQDADKDVESYHDMHLIRVKVFYQNVVKYYMDFFTELIQRDSNARKNLVGIKKLFEQTKFRLIFIHLSKYLSKTYFKIQVFLIRYALKNVCNIIKIHKSVCIFQTPLCREMQTFYIAVLTFFKMSKV